ncbi:alpha/beta fold hydrolase [Streptomyces sp. NPDC005706]|uniref:alpha/beta fold hydrolase n=1 Tax=Streptomyces sp. NPDC005706 TaxID=3157169 RepID=UPI0033E5E573
MTSSTTSVTTAVDRPLPNAEGAKHSWLEVRGFRLHIAEYGAGAPVLLLHGFPQHWFAWHRVAVQSTTGQRLICPDLRGFGWSQQTRRGYDIDGLADDMLALLDVLGLDRVHLVGHDWGAHVGFRLCLRAPERFSGYLALNMAHPWARQRAILPNVWRQWYTCLHRVSRDRPRRAAPLAGLRPLPAASPGRRPVGLAGRRARGVRRRGPGRRTCRAGHVLAVRGPGAPGAAARHEARAAADGPDRDARR